MYVACDNQNVYQKYDSKENQISIIEKADDLLDKLQWIQLPPKIQTELKTSKVMFKLYLTIDGFYVQPSHSIKRYKDMIIEI